MNGHPEYLKLLEEMKALHLNKAADYGDNEDPLGNLHACESIGIPAYLGAWIRAHDKVYRIDQFIKKGALVNESVEDSLMDLAAYGLLTIVLMRERMERTAKNPEPEPDATALEELKEKWKQWMREKPKQPMHDPQTVYGASVINRESFLKP